MSDAVIQIQNLYKSFGKSEILKNVTVDFGVGRIHGIIGRNGSGKTVLFKCICGFIPITSGKILVEGKEVGREVDIPRNMGIIIESPGFLPAYSGFMNLCFLARLQKRIGKKEIRETMQFVGLDPDDRKHVQKYSMGMRQRLGLAQAIMEDPDVLILDEPMNGLDNQGVQEIRQCLLDLKNQGKTILIASHNPEDINILCDSVWEMDAGKLSFISGR